MKAESDSFWFPAIHGMMPEEFIIPFDCMKILMNNQNYLVWGIPRVVKSMIWEKKAIFWKTEFVTVNLEDNNRKFSWMKVTTYPHHKNIEWYYDKEKFVKNLPSYISLTEIENDFAELISTLKYILTSEKPDLIILNGTWLMPWSLMKAAQWMNIPIIVYYHWSITAEEKQQIVKGKANILNAFEESFLREDSGFVFPSELLRGIVSKKFWVYVESLHYKIIPNSVPLYFFDSQKLSVTDSRNKKIRVGFVMRWCNVKNKDFVIQFIEYIRSHDLNYTVYLITDKEEIAMKDIGWISENIIIHTQLEYKELAIFLHECVDIIICPSKFETYGNIAQEAIALGTPVILSKNMWICETFETIWMHSSVVDFENTTIPQIMDLIHTTITFGVPKSALKILKENFQSRSVNQKRRYFFDNYVAWYHARRKMKK